MAVKIGHARIDENGNAHSGKAGDNNGKEVMISNWYKHSKGWRVFRAKDAGKAAKIAEAMKAACNNSKIGYDQWQRNTLYTHAAKVGFDISKVTTACETDCSALVRVCCEYAGITGLPSDFRTGNMPHNLLATGHFVELTGSKYTDQSTYLGAGDILVTKTSGHTVVVLTNGAKYEGQPTVNTTVKVYSLGDRTLKKGMTGSDVEDLQKRLNALGFDCGTVDGDFGKNTQKGVEALQTASKITVDGIFGKDSLKALKAFESPVSTYTVKAGDSLWKIAAVKLGKGSRYPEIMKLNNMTNTSIRVGQVLKIP